LTISWLMGKKLYTSPMPLYTVPHIQMYTVPHVHCTQFSQPYTSHGHCVKHVNQALHSLTKGSPAGIKPTTSQLKTSVSTTKPLHPYSFTTTNHICVPTSTAQAPWQPFKYHLSGSTPHSGNVHYTTDLQHLILSRSF
jgi:hypothetical protein